MIGIIFNSVFGAHTNEPTSLKTNNLRGKIGSKIIASNVLSIGYIIKKNRQVKRTVRLYVSVYIPNQ